jgi:hypothetical protein
VSTVLTLFLIPTLYLILEERFPRKPDPLMEPIESNGELKALPRPVESPVGV